MTRFRPVFLALLTSLLLFIASPGEWALTPLAWVALLPLLLACQGLTPRQGFRLGLLSGLPYYLGLIYWIIIALGHYGGLPLWLTLPALLGLALYMALFLAAFTALCCRNTGRPSLVWTAPLAWVGLDFIRGLLFTGFPWLDLGYSQYQWPLVNQVADLTGHHGITFLIVMVNALLADLLTRLEGNRKVPTENGHKLRFGDASSPSRAKVGMEVSHEAPIPDPPPGTHGGRGIKRLSHCPCEGYRLILPFVALAAAMGYGGFRQQGMEQALAQAPTIAIGLIQGNIDQSEKWEPTLQEQTVETYLDLSSRAADRGPLDLLIWPETALPFFPASHPLFQRITDRVAAGGSPPLLTGAPHFETDPGTGQTRYYNSAFLLAPTTLAQGVALQRYDKEHLVPFGEYIPLQRFLPEAMPLVQTMGNFSPGQESGPLVSGGARIGVLICFESIFPELARVRTGRGANILVNLTNDAWYGRSSAPFQQIPMAVLRAIENRRSLARAANTGISCLIDPLGRVVKASPIFTTLELSGRLPLVEGLTVFTRYGFLFPHLCLLLLSLHLFRRQASGNRRQE